MIIEWYRELFLFLWKYLGIFGGLVGISVVVSLVCLPLYHVIGRIVGMENALQSVLIPAVAKIKETYSDAAERQSAIERLYARFGYHPIMGVRKVLPLFVAIPFLLLTYHMLSGTSELEGVKWLCFSDLSKPDGLLFGFNLMPFVMTGVNILTVYATPCFNKKDEVQAWVIALFFLVLLYTANTALMIYWTLNQLFNFGRSLCENHFDGAKLLASRLLFFSPRNIAKLISGLRSIIDRIVLYSILALLVVSLYFSVFVRSVFKFHIGGGVNVGFALYSMVILATLATALSLYLLRGKSKYVKATALIGLIVSASFTVGMIVLRQFFHFYFRMLHSWIDYSIAVWLLILIFSLPFIVDNAKSLKGLSKEFIGICLKEADLLLLPLALAIHYSFSSHLFVLPIGSVLLLATYMIVGCVIFYAVLLLIFGRFITPSDLFIVAVGVVSAVYAIPLIAGEGIFSFECNLPFRLLLMLALPLMLFRFKRRKGLVVFLSLLLGAVIANAFMSHGKDIAPTNNRAIDYHQRLQSVIGDATCVKSNNIYLLVYDSYAHSTLIDALNLGDGGLTDFLSDNGFTIYDAYSVGADTVTSMHAAFTLGGVDGQSARSTMGGDNVFSDFVREAGYRTSYFLDGYIMPNRGERMPGDVYFPTPAAVTRPELVLLPCILCGTFSQSPEVFNSYTHEDWMNAYYEEMAKRPSSHYFIYAHNDYPAHAPTETRYRKGDAEEQRLFSERLEKARTDMIKSLDMLKEEKNAIIIIASDHGPHMMIPDPPGNYDARHLLDRHGIFLAIRWPSDYQPVLKLNCLQNVMLEVMIYLSGDRSLSRLEEIGSTKALDYPVGAPANSVNRGIIQNGQYKGMSLFTGAKEAFKREEK